MQAAIVLLLLCRVWTDSTGKYSTDAEFIDSHADTAYLQAGDHVKAVSLSRLSLDDQKFVAAQQNIKLIVGKVTSVSYNDSIVVRDDEAHDVRLVGIRRPCVAIRTIVYWRVDAKTQIPLVRTGDRKTDRRFYL